MSKNTAFDTSCFKELENSINRLGKLPQKCVTKAAKKGAKPVLSETKRNAPVDTGNLKKALALKAEKTRKKGKKVYQITFLANAEGLVKIGKNGNRAYYPASQEYGFQNRSGRYTPGYGYMKESAESNADTSKALMIEVLTDEIEKEWRKGK